MSWSAEGVLALAALEARRNDELDAWRRRCAAERRSRPGTEGCLSTTAHQLASARQVSDGPRSGSPGQAEGVHQLSRRASAIRVDVGRLAVRHRCSAAPMATPTLAAAMAPGRRCRRSAIPSLRPLAVPPGPGSTEPLGSILFGLQVRGGTSSAALLDGNADRGHPRPRRNPSRGQYAMKRIPPTPVRPGSAAWMPRVSCLARPPRLTATRAVRAMAISGPRSIHLGVRAWLYPRSSHAGGANHKATRAKRGIGDVGSLPNGIHEFRCRSRNSGCQSIFSRANSGVRAIPVSDCEFRCQSIFSRGGRPRRRGSRTMPRRWEMTSTQSSAP